MNLADLETELASMLDSLDIPGDWTQRQKNDYALRRHWLQNTIRGVKHAQEVLAAVEPRIVLLERQRDDLRAAREALVTEMLASPVSRTKAAYEKQRAYEISIRICDGKYDLQHEAVPNALPLPNKLQVLGYPASLAVPPGGLPSLPTLEQELRQLYKRRDAANSDLAALLPVTQTEASFTA